jgi:hypothetical protein
MDSSIIIGALALFTIGITLAAAVFHFGYFLKDAKNLEAAKTVAADRESATTRLASNTGTPHKSLRQRLDESQASRDKVPVFEPLRPHADISGRV